MESQSVFFVYTSDYYFGGDWYGTEFPCTMCGSKLFLSKIFSGEQNAMLYKKEWEDRMRKCCKMNLKIMKVEVPIIYQVYSNLYKVCSSMKEVEEILNNLMSETIIRERHLWYEKEKDKIPICFHEVEIHVVMTSNFQRIGDANIPNYMEPELKIFLSRSEADEYVISMYGLDNIDIKVLSKKLGFWY